MATGKLHTCMALLCRLALFVVLATLGSCASLPMNIEPTPEQHALAPASSGILAQTAQAVARSAGPDQSGFWLLDKNADALNWRLALVDSAVSSLDLLYYLWYGDNSGSLLLKRVLMAADRGVRVRLLIDDLLLIGGDKTLVALHQHPNIQLRMFNPRRQRKLGMGVEYIGRFKQLNSRMHKKLLVADNQAAIVGGRNIGDDYFGLKRSYNFHDLDVLGFGPVARQASDLFDNVWNSPLAVSASELPARVNDQESREMRAGLLHKLESSDDLVNIPVQPRDWTDNFGSLAGQFYIGSSEIIYDRFENGELRRGMADSVGRMLKSAERDIHLLNAYIIPNKDFIDAIGRMTASGVNIRILTNSLASHDVPAVNSHYKKWRKPMVEAGAELYELRSDPAISSLVDTDPVVARFTGLHTKAFVIDGHRIFIGSMNFDPRSANINTEMGVIIESRDLGRLMEGLAERDMAPESAWHVEIGPEGKLVWVNSVERVTRQPARNAWQRIMDGFFGFFPASQF